MPRGRWRRRLHCRRRWRRRRRRQRRCRWQRLWAPRHHRAVPRVPGGGRRGGGGGPLGDAGEREHRTVSAVPVVVAIVPVVVLLVHPCGLLGSEHLDGGVDGRLIADAKGYVRLSAEAAGGGEGGQQRQRQGG